MEMLMNKVPTQVLEALLKPKITPQVLHPATRPRGKSFCRREIEGRNRTTYGKRQICIVIVNEQAVVHRDYHMPAALRKAPQTKPRSALENYQHAIYTSGYRLLEGTPDMLIYQYEGR